MVFVKLEYASIWGGVLQELFRMKIIAKWSTPDAKNTPKWREKECIFALVAAMTKLCDSLMQGFASTLIVFLVMGLE